MKNFMPILSEKSVDSLTFAISPHQHRAASIPSGKLAYFIFFGLRPWSEQGKLIATNLNDTAKIAGMVDRMNDEYLVSIARD
jgi:hypothetical protein